MTPTFSIIVPTAGRDTLARTLASVASQLEPGDELLVRRADCEYGNATRDHLTTVAAGTHLLFMDDDDVYTTDALATIRPKVAADPDRVHVFRMVQPNGMVLWQVPELLCGQVGTPMVVIPNVPGKLGTWANPHAGVSDFAYFQETVNARGDQPVFHEDVVALVRP